MPRLTAKQQAFASALAEGMNQSDAYRAAFSAGNMKPATIASKASLLAGRDDIGARVDELRDKLADQELWTRVESVETLKKVALHHTSTGSEVVSAVKALNDMHGYDKPKKVEVEHRNLKPITDEDWL